MLLNFQMILQGHYLGLDTPVLLKIIKSTIFIFSACPLLCTFLFNYTILLYFYNIRYQSRTFYYQSRTFNLSVRTFCYQSRTFLVSIHARNVDIIKYLFDL